MVHIELEALLLWLVVEKRWEMAKLEILVMLGVSMRLYLQISMVLLVQLLHFLEVHCSV